MTVKQRIRWYGPRIQRDIRNTMKDRLDSLADLLIKIWRRKVRRASPPPSRPGSWPKKRTGEFREGIRKKLDRRSLSIELDNVAPHAIYVEARNPSLRRILREERKTIRAALIKGTGVRGRYKFVKQ